VGEFVCHVHHRREIDQISNHRRHRQGERLVVDREIERQISLSRT